jgi:hypothetical protein
MGLAAAASLRGQTSAARGRELVEKTINALGGDGFRNMTARVENGRAYSFYREQINGLDIARIYTKYLPADSGPGLKLKQRQAFGKKQDSAVILTEKAGWQINYKGAMPLPAQRLSTFVDSTLHDIFYILRERVNEPGLTFESQGRDVVENSPVETIQIYDAENRNVTVWLHQDTFLPVKQRFTRWDPQINDRREEVTRYTKYRESGDGVMWPYDTQRERDQEKIFELYADKVTVGGTLEDSLFEVPSGMTVLKPK